MPFVIDIDPVAFTILEVPVRWSGLILGMAVGVAITIAHREAGRRDIEGAVVSDVPIWVGAGSLRRFQAPGTTAAPQPRPMVAPSIP